MDKTFLAALISVAFGWSLNELGQWFRIRKEDKRIKKMVLYVLLETHFKFGKLDLSEFVQLVTDKVLSKVPKADQSEELKQYLNEFYLKMIQDLLHADVSKELVEIEEKYTTAIDNLAAVDPIAAYRLNGKTQIMETFESLKKYYEGVKAHFPGQEALVESQITIVTNHLKSDYIRNSISDIEKEIYKISFSINPWIWIKAKRTLSKQHQRRRIESEKKLNEIFEKLDFSASN